MRFLSLSFITLAVSLQRKKEKNEKKKEIKNNKKKNKQKKDTKKPTTIGETKKTVRKHIHAKIQQSFAFAKRQNEKRKKKKQPWKKGEKKVPRSFQHCHTVPYISTSVYDGSVKKKRKKKKFVYRSYTPQTFSFCVTFTRRLPIASEIINSATHDARRIDLRLNRLSSHAIRWLFQLFVWYIYIHM